MVPTTRADFTSFGSHTTSFTSFGSHTTANFTSFGSHTTACFTSLRSYTTASFASFHSHNNGVIYMCFHKGEFHAVRVPNLFSFFFKLKKKKKKKSLLFLSPLGEISQSGSPRIPLRSGHTDVAGVGGGGGGHERCCMPSRQLPPSRFARDLPQQHSFLVGSLFHVLSSVFSSLKAG